MAAGDLLDDIVKLTVERRDEYQKWLQDNYGEEFEDVQRAINCRTKPIMVKDAAGNSVEDPTRTNVCMPPGWLIARKKKARLTANAPHINYIVPSDNDQLVSERLTALSYQMFDRSGENAEHKKLVHQAVALGFVVSKVFWDKVEFVRQFRKLTINLSRQELMKLQGAPADEVSQAVSELGDALSPDEQSQAISQLGNEVQQPVDVTKYEGPVVRALFLGDISFDSGVSDFNLSDWYIEEYLETDLWLQKWAKRTYCDPETGEETPVMDAKKLDELLEMGQVDTDELDKLYDLKKTLRDAINKNQGQLRDKRLLRRKKFRIYEMHEADENGVMWIHWIGNKKVELGKMPYPWDMYGKSIYTALNLMPNITSPIGDSSPRMMRFLFAIHNSTVGQRNDLISNILRRTYKVARLEDIPEQVIEKAFGRILVTRGKDSLEPIVEPDAPASAWETEAQILRMMAMAEPSLNTTDTGSDSNPMAGKLATTALLNAKAADSLTQDEVSQVDIYFKELGEKKLWMLQQAQTDKLKVAGQYVRTEALSERYGKTSLIEIDPYEIQEDIQVEPEAGSMLSVDDDLRRTALLQAYQFAEADPITWNRPYLASKVAGTLRGVDPKQAINPPQKPNPIGKVNFAISSKVDLPGEVVNQLLVEAGLQPSEELLHRDTLDGVKRMSEAADAADNLDKTAESTLPNDGREPSVPGFGKKKKTA